MRMSSVSELAKYEEDLLNEFKDDYVRSLGDRFSMDQYRRTELSQKIRRDMENGGVLEEILENLWKTDLKPLIMESLEAHRDGLNGFLDYYSEYDDEESTTTEVTVDSMTGTGQLSLLDSSYESTAPIKILSTVVSPSMITRTVSASSSDTTALFTSTTTATTTKTSHPPTTTTPVAYDLSQLIGKPRITLVQAISKSSAVVQWTAVPGADEYTIQYSDAPTEMNQWLSHTILAAEKGHQNEIILRDLANRMDYVFCVKAVVEKQAGKCSKLEVKNINPVHMVSNLRAQNIRAKELTLTWEYRGDPAFYVEGSGEKVYFDGNGTEITTKFNISSKRETKHKQVLLESLRPSTNYTFKIGVRKSKTEKYYPATIAVTTLTDSPPFVRAPQDCVGESLTTASIKVQPATEEYGPIKHYWIVVVQSNLTRRMGKPDPQKFSTLNLKRRSMGSDAEAYIAMKLSRKEMLDRYRRQAANRGRLIIGDGSNDDPENDIVNRPLKPKVEYKAFIRAFIHEQTTEGYEKHQDSQFSPTITPLTSTTPVGGGGGGGTDKGSVTERSSSIWLIGPIVAVLIITVIIGMLIIWWLRRNKKQKNLPTKHHINQIALSQPNVGGGPTETSKLLTQDQFMSPSAIPNGYDPMMKGMMPPANHHEPMEMSTYNNVGRGGGEPGTHLMNDSHPPVPITELAAHIDRLKYNDNLLFQQEYESIETGQQFTWENSSLECNRSKNRYANVIAYDHSRVVLSSTDSGVDGSTDYINANFIDGYRKPKAYVATQGPLPETFADFWHMVWELKTQTIVMLTKLEERTRIKCDHYWPLRGSMMYGSVQVTLLDTFQLAHYTIRTFRIQKRGENEVRDVRQLQFTAWPDHGVPDHPTPFLSALKRVKSINPQDAGPIITHCSAGVGRTGAYIVIDCMLDRLRFENTVDIYGCVTALRSQRNYMVQTADQYVFIHDAVLDAVQSGSTEVPAGKLYTHIQALLQIQPLDNATGMELEFRHLTALKMPNAQFSAANIPINKQKNRLVNILPYDSSRVVLQSIPGEGEGSDYINGSWIDGYRSLNAYIGTQGTLPNTIDDFWRMLWEHNSCIIVMLTHIREMGREKCAEYWPMDSSARYGALVVDPIAEYNMPQYILREFKLTHTQSGQSRTIRHFQYSEWPEQGVPKSGEMFIEFIGQVHKTKEQFGAEGPITVHCSAGVGRTGVFITLSIVLERMRFENVVDIFTTVKLLRTQRPNMVQSEDQYHFCYQAALEYLGSFDHYAVQG